MPDDLGDAIGQFKEQFAAAAASRAAADPTAVDAEELGAARSQKTLATE